MSRNMAYRDDSRVDSALDLSLTRRYMADHDLESSQTVSASSAMPYAEPWSQFNPREPDLHSPYTPYDWPPETHIFDDLNADINAPCDSAFERSLSRIASGLQCASPEAASLTGYSPPPSPPLPQPWAVASSATASSPLPTSRYTDSNTACCGQCSQQFRGSYRRGNLARHVRHKHQGAKGGPYTCTADGCFRVYQRQDARLKHMRKKHPDLPLPTYQSRRGLEHCSTGLSDSERTFGQHSSVEPESIGHCETTSPQRLTPAHHVFATLQQKLDYVTFSETCDNFFMRWERIVHELRITQSSAYPAYAKVLDDITAAVRDIDTRTHGCISDAQGGSKSCAPHGQRAGPRGNGRLAGGRTTKVQSDRISKSTSRKQHTGKSGNDGLLTLYDELLLPDNIEVDCPVFKYHSMNSFNPPCNGCRVSSMSQVRSHLNPDRNGRHGGYPAFVRQCSRCLEDFIDKRSYDDHKNSNSCTSETRVQGHIIIFWARQYLKLYPQVTRVPLPCKSFSSARWMHSS
ncbi:hypothetical protein BKA63DRAFT_84812 [Paraphoma chrysanthemicola]|nr:hypothetical protein BKA63DRAFT_84812 [Paraphoma chrysanthemicola]